MQNYIQKLKMMTIVGLTVALIIPFGLLAQPKKVEAVGAVTGFDLISDVKEIGLDTIASFVKSIVIAALTESIINWINSGFEGNPSFIDNPEAFYTDVANEVTGAFINELGLGFLCEPFGLQIQIALASQDSFRDRAECTVADVLDNYDAFIDDFSQGGWAGWISITQNPQNNVYGAYLIAGWELDKRKQQAEQESRDDLSQGQGYRSAKECLEYDSDADSYSEDGTYIGPYRKGGITGCTRYRITSPAIVLKAQVEASIGTALRQLELSDEITDAVAAIATALIKKVVSDGVRSLTDSSGDSPKSTWGKTVNEDTGKTAVEEDKANLKQTMDNELAIQEAIKNEIGLKEIKIIDRLLICYDEQLTLVTDEFYKENINRRVGQLEDLKVTRAAAQHNADSLKSLSTELATTTTIQGLSHNWNQYNKYEKNKEGGDLMGTIIDSLEPSKIIGKMMPSAEEVIKKVAEAIGKVIGNLLPGSSLFKAPTVSPYAFMNFSISSQLSYTFRPKTPHTTETYTYYDLGYRTHEACTTDFYGTDALNCLNDLLIGALGDKLGKHEIGQCHVDVYLHSWPPGTNKNILFAKCLVVTADKYDLSGSSSPVDTNTGEGPRNSKGHGGSPNTPKKHSAFTNDLLDEETDCKNTLFSLKYPNSSCKKPKNTNTSYLCTPQQCEDLVGDSPEDYQNCLADVLDKQDCPDALTPQKCYEEAGNNRDDAYTSCLKRETNKCNI